MSRRSRTIRPVLMSLPALLLAGTGLAQQPPPAGGNILPPVTVQAPRQAVRSARPAARAVAPRRQARLPARNRRAASRQADAPAPSAQAGPSPVAVPGLDPSAGPNTGGSPTAPSVQAQRASVLAIPGAVSFIDATSFQNRYTNSLPDILKEQPGVWAQTRYGQEIRLSIRGSGLGRAFHLRGVELLQDGIPLNFADGSGDFYGIDPLSLRSLEIYRGGNALAFGATTLGGAINAVTPTAHNAIAPNMVRIEGGSFGALRTNVQASRIEGAADGLISATYSHQDGFRRHQAQDYLQLNGNVGYRFAPGAETRFYFGYNRTDQKLPGTLDLFQALTFPERASSTTISGNQKRDVTMARIANRTTFEFEAGRFDLDSWLIHKRLYHPIFQVIDQDGLTYGIAPRWTSSFDIAGHRNDFLVGGRAYAGENAARQYVNISGQTGALTASARQHARNLEAFVDNRFWLNPQLALATGAKWLRHDRDLTNLFTVPAQRADRTYQGFNPKIGVLWQPTPDIQAFANLTRSRDVPDFSDLAQSNNYQLMFVPLEAQKAWTAEIGTRGRWDRLRWDVTFYHSTIRDELLTYSRTGNGSVPATTFNAPRTSRTGIELAASYDLVRDVSGPGAGDTISISQIWTMTDARFVGDAAYGNNRIAGLPPHVLRTILAYRRPDGFYVAPTLDWVPVGAFADHANALKVPGYTLIGLQAGMDFGNGLSVYVDARNLANRRYISDLGPVTNAVTTPAANFYPGEGRSVFAGLRYVY
ncbi:TonB-dependent receptor family protein [Enterovirga rhinocerotis]|uniref:Iron complex outermembrane receptor protein n=1 Tax=Enterovirga rhinocerotis TaxID=1339210 RepID=A0A4R7CA66_9HYPH|nr:TonB-dependent receptor [Enterovirga rhinocerotis]TDR93687.1 iron complex outermembrane receptor protein [Enterovirga rhinocerotis]